MMSAQGRDQFARPEPPGPPGEVVWTKADTEFACFALVCGQLRRIEMLDETLNPPMAAWSATRTELFTSQPIRAIYDGLADGLRTSLNG